MKRRRTVSFMQNAVDDWRACRSEFEEYRLAAYQTAERAVCGRMLNRRGKRLRIDPYSLFLGPEARAMAYASEELVEHWRRHARPVFEKFESQHVRNLRMEQSHG